MSMQTRKKESGGSLTETMIAVMLLMVMGAGMTAVFGFCTGTNKSQGEIATRTTEYAQDKMEQLTALSYLDGSTNTTVYPSAPTGGTGLGGVMAGNATVGGTARGAAVLNYVDYLDVNGNLSVTGALYTRQWSITTNAAGNLKTITVVVYASSAQGPGAAPSSTLISMKSNNQ